VLETTLTKPSLGFASTTKSPLSFASTTSLVPYSAPKEIYPTMTSTTRIDITTSRYDREGQLVLEVTSTFAPGAAQDPKQSPSSSGFPLYATILLTIMVLVVIAIPLTFAFRRYKVNFQ